MEGQAAALTSSLRGSQSSTPPALGWGLLEWRLILSAVCPQVPFPRCPCGTSCPICHRRSSAASPRSFPGACAVSWASGWRTSPGESPWTLPPWSSTGLGVTQGRVGDPCPFSQLFPSPGSSSMAQTPSAAAWPAGCSRPCWRNSAALPAAMGSSARSCSKSATSRCAGTLGLGHWDCRQLPGKLEFFMLEGLNALGWSPCDPFPGL